jgi:hypothetical protein
VPDCSGRCHNAGARGIALRGQPHSTPAAFSLLVKQHADQQRIRGRV